MHTLVKTGSHIRIVFIALDLTIYHLRFLKWNHAMLSGINCNIYLNRQAYVSNAMYNEKC